MRTSSLLVVGLSVLLGFPLGAFAQATAQEAECRAIIEKALAAQGSEKVALSIKATQAKGKGTIHFMDMALEFTLEALSNLPDQNKNLPAQNKAMIQLTINNMNIDVINVVDGDKGWASAAGNILDLDADQLKEAKEQMHVESVTSLYPLKDKAKGFGLSSLGESKVGDATVVGIQVTKKGKRDINLFFDKKTHLLLKAEYRAVEPFNKQEVNQEKFFSGYKELIDGFKMPSKINVKNDGNKFLELELTEVRSVDRHDASVFAKPK
jgi:hypothetical protein